MLRGLYIAATGMLTQRKRMDVVTNNLTNVDTVGYKRDEVINTSFADVLTVRLHDQNPFLMDTSVGDLTYGAYVEELYTDQTQGGLEPTERISDFAIAGDGYFVVQTPEGERYTRGGNFTVNQQGWLLTNEGYFVMGENGPLNVGVENNFDVRTDGTVRLDGQYLDRMLIVDFQDQSMLRKEGDNLFTNPLGTPMVAATGEIRQATLEGSNVDLGVEMTDMIQLNRIYEANQRMLTTVDASLEKTVNEIGRV